MEIETKDAEGKAAGKNMATMRYYMCAKKRFHSIEIRKHIT